MDTNHLDTQFHVPSSQPGMLKQPHLFNQLNEGLQPGCRLILISATKGAGKTSLLKNWLKSGDFQNRTLAVWLTLNIKDNHPFLFFQDLIGAFQAAIPEFGQPARNILNTPFEVISQEYQRNILTTLLIELNRIQDPAALILDDYQNITSPIIHAFLNDFIEQMSNRHRIIILSHTEPPLPLYRLRAAGQIIELHDNDLRFTLDNLDIYLNDMLHLQWSLPDLEILQERISGHTAAVSLAGLAAKGFLIETGRGAEAELIRNISSSPKSGIEFLFNTVFNSLPQQIQTFLRYTSQLETFNLDLCCAVFSGEIAEFSRAQIRDFLDYLYPKGIFLTSQDTEQNWFSYSPVYVNYLNDRFRLDLSDSNQMAKQIHHLASDWFEQNGMIDAAIEYAIRAENFYRAAEWIIAHFTESITPSVSTQLLNWFDRMPQPIFQQYPEIPVLMAWSYFISGQIDQAEEIIERIRLGRYPENERSIGLSLALTSDVFIGNNEFEQALHSAENALEFLPNELTYARGHVIQVVGRCFQEKSNEIKAISTYTELADMYKSTHHIHLALIATNLQAGAMLKLGQLHEAHDKYTRIFEKNQERIGKDPAAGQFYIGYGRIMYHWNRLDEAAICFNNCIENGQYWNDPNLILSGCMNLALVHFAQGEMDDLNHILKIGSKLIEKGTPSQPAAAEYLAHLALIKIRQLKLDEAVHWVLELHARPGFSPESLLYSERTTLARIYLAIQEPQNAHAVLDSLLQENNRPNAVEETIELQILQALAFQMENKSAEALNLLRSSLSITEQGGYLRYYIDEGEPMYRLLHQVPPSDPCAGYAQMLAESIQVKTKPVSYLDRFYANTSLPQPLSVRELDVLRLLASEASIHEIAGQIVIAASTVKSHVHSLYQKLGVSNRKDLIAKARKIGLLD